MVGNCSKSVLNRWLAICPANAQYFEAKTTNNVMHFYTANNQYMLSIITQMANWCCCNELMNEFDYFRHSLLLAREMAMHVCLHNYIGNINK